MIQPRRRFATLRHDLTGMLRPGPSKQPILIVGNGRSGTSWIGEALARAPEVLYYREPCHPTLNGLDTDLAERVWCRYVRPGERDPFFEFTLGRAFRGRFWRGCGLRKPSPGHRPQRVLIKEVAAFLSAEWVAARWQPKVLVILRHPGAYAVSVRNLDQNPREITRLRLLCSDPALHEDCLDGPLRDRLLGIENPLEASVASWAIRTKVALAALARNPDWLTVHYEDVARAPLEAFRNLYASCGLAWSDGVAAWVQEKSSSHAKGNYTTSRISEQRIDAWRAQLAEAEVAQVRRVLDLFEFPLYAEEADWVKPTDRGD